MMHWDPSQDIPDEDDPFSDPRHFTREPWWVVPLAGAVTAVLPLWRYHQFQQALAGMPIPLGMAFFGVMGMVAAFILVVRSRVRSPFLANVIVWFGILLAATEVSIVVLILSG